MLTKLAVSASERVDTHETLVNSLGAQMEQLAEAQKQIEANLTALSQIVVELAQSQRRAK